MVYCGAAGMHSSSLKPLPKLKKIPISIRKGFNFGSVLAFLLETNLCYAKPV